MRKGSENMYYDNIGLENPNPIIMIILGPIVYIPNLNDFFKDYLVYI